MKRQIAKTLFGLVVGLFVASAAWAAGPLAAASGDPGRVSVSGLSSGAFMALQYHVAFSASTMGVGVVAGGPYYCSGALLLPGAGACLGGVVSAAASKDAAVGFAAAGLIDPVDGIARARVYLFSGTKDTIVAPSVVAAARDFYRLLGVGAMAYVGALPAGHAFLSVLEGNTDCGVTQSPFVNECVDGPGLYDQPAAILTQIYGALAPYAGVLSSSVVAFDQTEFASPLAYMADTGYVYVPAACTGGGVRCAVHVVFHGCLQAADVKTVADAVYDKLGYNRWADTNGIIVLYPQINSGALPETNPNGCWDWWGYTGPDYPVQSGRQMSAVRAMVQRLTGQ